MTRIYIVRHAEAEGNLYRRVHGWYDSLITENGYRQIAALAHRFSDIPVDAVYSSDLFRTRTTAAAVYRPKGLELRTDSALREIHMGAWEDRSWGDVARADSAALLRFNDNDDAWKVPASETFPEVGERMRSAVLRLAAAHPGQTIALFSHGTAIRTLLCTLKGLDPASRHVQGHSDNTGVTCLEVEGDQVSVVFENDSSHLTPEISTLARQKWWRTGHSPLSDPNLWYRPLNMEREGRLYRDARREAWLDIHGSLERYDDEGFFLDALEHWRQDRRSLTAAMLGDELAGILQLDLTRGAEEGAGYIPFFYMTPRWRRHGLGVQLLGQAVSVFRPMGRDKLRLCCVEDNRTAQRFYERWGFRRIGEVQGARAPLDLLEKYIGYDAP